MKQEFNKISPALFGLIVICFFLPFMNISCGGQKIVTLTGLQFVTGTSVEQQDPFSGKAKSEKIESEPLAVAVFLCALAGLALSFLHSRSGTILPAIAGGAGGGLLLLFKHGMDQKVLQEGEGLIQVQYEFGFWLMLMLFLAATVMNLLLLSHRKNE